MALQDDVDQKVTDDVQLHIGKLSYNNIVLAAQVNALQTELTKAYDKVTQLETAAADRASAPAEGDVIQGEAVAGSGETAPE